MEWRHDVVSHFGDWFLHNRATHPGQYEFFNAVCLSNSNSHAPVVYAAPPNVNTELVMMCIAKSAINSMHTVEWAMSPNEDVEYIVMHMPPYMGDNHGETFEGSAHSIGNSFRMSCAGQHTGHKVLVVNSIFTHENYFDESVTLDTPMGTYSTICGTCFPEQVPELANTPWRDAQIFTTNIPIL